MKKMNLIIYLYILQTASSCHKSGTIMISPASINIINAIPSSQPIIPVFGTSESIRYFANAQTVPYGNSIIYTPLSGSNSLYIVQKTAIDTLLTDTKLFMFNGTLNLFPGAIYSFFLTGDTTKPDTLFIQDHIPYYTDSSAGIRIINLSLDSQPISVNIQGNSPTQWEFSNLAYKSVSAFNKYAANSTVPGSMYTFEFRNQANDSLLMTYYWYYTPYKSNTLVISGWESPVSPSPLNIFQVDNF